MEKRILLYGFEDNSERTKSIYNIAKDFNIETKKVEKEDLNSKVGYLIGLKGFEKNLEEFKGQAPDTEFILFSDFDREVIRDFILALKNQGISINHKSVITVTTKDWDFIYLIEHIIDEHETVLLFNKLGLLVKKAQDKLKEDNDEKLKEAFDFAISVKDLADPSKEDIIKRYRKLEEALGGKDE